MSRRQAWIGFWIVVLIWGSSFMFIRMAVKQLGPFELVFIRTGIAAICITLLAYSRGLRFPKTWTGIRALVLLGVGNVVLPFSFITFGEKSIDSGLAAVLQSTVALFSLVISHFMFDDDRITQRKVVGIMVGFVGVVILVSGSISAEGLQNSSLWGQLAIIVASLCYGWGGAYSRKVMHSPETKFDPFIVAAGSMIAASFCAGILMLLMAQFGNEPIIRFADMNDETLKAVLTLGFLNTFGAYAIFYPVIKVLGSSKSSMVTYAIPAVALTLGAIFLNEVVDLRLVIGGALILLGISIVSLKMLSFKRG